MIIIKIEPFNNGAHDNQTWGGDTIPNGWAKIPEDMEVPDTFPFVDITVEDGIVQTITPGIVPEPEDEPEPGPSEMEQLRADINFIALMTGVEL